MSNEAVNIGPRERRKRRLLGVVALTVGVGAAFVLVIFEAPRWSRALVFFPVWMAGLGLWLNLDPSHLIWLMIDYERVVRDYAPKLFHVHAKDMEIDRDGLYRNGTVSLGMGWQVPRLPGLGEVRWDRFVAALYREGYDFVVSIEHEDRAFEGTEELVKRGFLIARDALKSLLH